MTSLTDLLQKTGNLRMTPMTSIPDFLLEKRRKDEVDHITGLPMNSIAELLFRQPNIMKPMKQEIMELV